MRTNSSVPGWMIALAAVVAFGAATCAHIPTPVLEGRAVLPVNTYAPGPPSGALFDKSPNGITFPTPSQPVAGFSALVSGRHAGEYLGMLDNGFGAKANSQDFLIRAYYIEPDFKTANGGSGTVVVKDFISFRDPNRKIGFAIVNEATADRLLTGGDIDPESMQRARTGDYWVGDEFGPWILHFDATGVLLDAPYPVPGKLIAASIPGDLMSPNNPFRIGAHTHPESRGFEAMAITPDGMHLIAILEGPTVADGPDSARRLVFEFSIGNRAFTGRTWWYRTEHSGHFIADLAALDEQRLVVIERDNGLGPDAVFRSLYIIDLRRVDRGGFLEKERAADLTAIPDPNRVSLPPIHTGDFGLGNPFRVTCESIEAVLVLSEERLLLGCDNNFPNKGRNPDLADDSEFIVVKIPGLRVAPR